MNQIFLATTQNVAALICYSILSPVVGDEPMNAKTGALLATRRTRKRRRRHLRPAYQISASVFFRHSRLSSNLV
jgi:hypothetical protein